MSKEDEAATRSRQAPTRRSVLAIFPAALLGGWMSLGRRACARPGSREAPRKQPSHLRQESAQVPCYSYSSGEIKGQPSSDGPVWITELGYDEQGRIVQEVSFTADRRIVQYHYYQV